MKKLNLMLLEEQQLDKKQLEGVQGGVNWCDCWDTGPEDPNNSVSVWQSTPPGGSNPAQAGAQQPGINWCDCWDVSSGPLSSVSVWQSTPSPC